MQLDVGELVARHHSLYIHHCDRDRFDLLSTASEDDATQLHRIVHIHNLRGILGRLHLPILRI